jgi:hypothetical protein
MITMTTPTDRVLGRVPSAGDLRDVAAPCERGRAAVRNAWRNTANSLAFVGRGNTTAVARHAHLDNGTTTPAGAQGYMAVKRPARNLRPRIT